MNIQYIGKIPVKLSGARGWIQPGQTLSLPEKIVNNLILDKENWKRIEQDESTEPQQPETNTSPTEDIPQQEEPPAGESPGEDKKKRRK
jgi:hypothetical protein